MRINRHFTKSLEGNDLSVFDLFKWKRLDSRIMGTDGKVVFEMHGVEVPDTWGQMGTDILASKYCRKAGAFVRADDLPFAEKDGFKITGTWTLKDSPIGGILSRKDESDGEPIRGAERSARQVVWRLVTCWTANARKYGYFNPTIAELESFVGRNDVTDDDRERYIDTMAAAFRDELAYMLLAQMAAPNSPQWFNAGIFDLYGMDRPTRGNFVADHLTGEVRDSGSAYAHPQVHACFLLSVADNLVEEDGIFDLLTREARLFKMGSGTGTNYSKLRAANERLSSGGKSSGLMSWLKILDAAAGAVKSGGVTRRAAKLACLDMDHPDILQFIRLKAKEELKVSALVEGAAAFSGDDAAYAERVGLKLDYDFNGEAYGTVTGQNANNSVRITDDFMQRAMDADPVKRKWATTYRKGGKVAHEYDASYLLDEISVAAWRSADPGMQYHTTMNSWHTCPKSGEVSTTNPCSEYVFINNTACNLASINVLKFYDAEKRTFDVYGFTHAVTLWTLVLEVSVAMAGYPSEKLAELSWRTRTLGLGYANLGAMLMAAGLAYDSPEGRAICGLVTSIMTGAAYVTSGAIAGQFGPFADFATNRDDMLRVMRNHRAAIDASHAYEGLNVCPARVDMHAVEAAGSFVENAVNMHRVAVGLWDAVVSVGEQHGFRNAQATVIAPTGTIGLLMECDTTGIEPDYALVKFKKLAGGGYMKIVNNSVPMALKTLGYSAEQIDDIITYICGTGTLNTRDLEHIAAAKLKSRSAYTEDMLKDAFDISHVISGLREALPSIVFDEMNARICGAKTVEGAPHLKPLHYAVFDCAATGGERGTRAISASGHIGMMAAAQPFISGAISKTINLPGDCTVDDVRAVYVDSWRRGLKAVSLYRDGSKKSQPLNTTADGSTTLVVHELRAQLSRLHEKLTGKTATETADLRELRALTDESLNAATQMASKVKNRRKRLPDTADAKRHRFEINGHKGYLHVGHFEDGTPGEVFVTMGKEGSTIDGLTRVFAITLSTALQYGVPLEALCRKLKGQRFEPSGYTSNKALPTASSIADYLAKWLEVAYLAAPEAFERQNGHKPHENGSGGRLNLNGTYGSNGHAAAPLALSVVAPVNSGNGVTAAIAAYSASGSDASSSCPTCGMLMVSAGGCQKCPNCGHGGSCG